MQQEIQRVKDEQAWNKGERKEEVGPQRGLKPNVLDDPVEKLHAEAVDHQQENEEHCPQLHAPASTRVVVKLKPIDEKGVGENISSEGHEGQFDPDQVLLCSRRNHDDKGWCDCDHKPNYL